MDQDLDLAVLRPADDPEGKPVDRRDFLRRAGIAMAGLTAMAALLEGCGGEGLLRGVEGSQPGTDNLLQAVVKARADLQTLTDEAFTTTNPTQAILLTWISSLNLIIASVWVLALNAASSEISGAVHPQMTQFLAQLVGPLAFSGSAPAFTLALLLTATSRTESILGSLPYADIRGMWIYTAFLALMLPGLSNALLLNLSQHSMSVDTSDHGGTIFDAFLGSSATFIGNPSLFIAAALIGYATLASHMNGNIAMLLGPRIGALLMLMLLMTFLIAT